MANDNRARSEDVTIQVFLDGNIILRAKANPTDFTHSPKITVSATRFIGEHAERHSQMYSGGQFSGTLQCHRPCGALAMAVKENAQGTGRHQIDIQATQSFRSGERQRTDLTGCAFSQLEESISGMEHVTLAIGGESDDYKQS
jgi:hypothetical protein